MHSWHLHGHCSCLPMDWWDTGDDGNRLALALCGVCPVLEQCARTRRREWGVIRAGIAYGEDGKPLGLCRCGYPNRHRIAWRTGLPSNPRCHRCKDPVLRRWSSRNRYWAEYYQRRKEAAAA